MYVSIRCADGRGARGEDRFIENISTVERKDAMESNANHWDIQTISERPIRRA